MRNDYNFIDLSYINEISDDNIEVKRELIEIFLTQIPEFKSDFDLAIETKNWKLLAHTAHKAKSSVLSMGLESLGKVDLKNLELIAHFCNAKRLELIEAKTEKEISDLDDIYSNLKGYSDQKMQWIEENISEKNIKELVNKFSDICENATLELNCELNKRTY